MSAPSQFTIIFCIVCCIAVGQTSEEVGEAVRRGVAYLIKQQAIDGSWYGPQVDRMPTGASSLALYTLLESGVPKGHRAVQKGLAFVRSHPAEKTYVVGMRLMVEQALGASKPTSDIKKLAKFLLDNQQRSGWGYPDSSQGGNPIYSDQSNTQYALLGLRAAARCGLKIKTSVWVQAAKGLLGEQGRNGGWGYQRKTEPTGAMSMATMAGLVICRDQLTKGKRQRKLCREIDEALSRGDEWMSKHWTVKFNPALPKRTDRTNDQLYYYLYGLERVGSLLRTETIGKHPWYSEGTVVLLKRQESDGGWKASYQKLADTCFALLFLRRGTRATTIAPRVARRQEAGRKAALAITLSGDSSIMAWVVRANTAVVKRLESGEQLKCLTWYVNGDPVAELAPANDGDDRYTLRHAFKTNAEHTVQAIMSFYGLDGGATGTEKSNILKVGVDGVLEAVERAALADLGKSLIDRDAVTVKASSSAANWTKPAHVSDALHATRWSPKPDDQNPWIHIKLHGSIRVSELRLNLYGIRRVAITLDRSRPITTDVDPATTDKKIISFSRRALGSIHIRVLERVPDAKAIGIWEIEAMK